MINDEIVKVINNLHKENQELKKENERLKSINYHLSTKCRDCEKSLDNGKNYLKKLNENFEKIFNISLKQFLNIEYKKD